MADQALALHLAATMVLLDISVEAQALESIPGTL